MPSGPNHAIGIFDPRMTRVPRSKNPPVQVHRRTRVEPKSGVLPHGAIQDRLARTKVFFLVLENSPHFVALIDVDFLRPEVKAYVKGASFNQAALFST